MKTVKQHKSGANFLRLVSSRLYKNEDVCGLLLGICETLAKRGESVQTITSPRLLRVVEGTRLCTVALQTPPKNLILTKASSNDLKALATYLHEQGVVLPGVIGPPQEVNTFIKHWRQLTGTQIDHHIDQGIYRLDRVIMPPPISGRMEKATEKDVSCLARWLGEFLEESLPSDVTNHKEYVRMVRAKIAEQHAFVWRVGHKAVSMAFATRPTKNGISIGPVYTPKNQRAKGYATAIVAALSEHLLNMGWQFCTLYTDLSNPTSNGIYKKIGYRSIGRSRHTVFKI